MASLAARQQHFLDRVRGVSADAPPLTEGPVASALGLAVYASAYRARLREALAADHPRLARHLGEDAWRDLCDAYVDAHPSRVRSLRAFGDALPAFIADCDIADARMLAELACFERGLLDAFDAADAPRFDWSSIESLPAHRWPGLRLRFHPSLRRLALSTPAVAIWQSLADEADPHETMGVIPAAVFVWRDAERITRFRAFADDENAALLGMLDGDAFAALCERQLAVHAAAEVPLRAIGWLRTWVDDGLVAALADADGSEAA